ncbi:hypothetical protein Zm00014a_019960 [Zea mays]|uniref:Uncharacterized protein n=1 Tax=Zea mays TaxID=4577 RepID=A0A3L6G5V0_MAIZE|nr:hypothetical protein Zm00014a_019960 [Zea mays]
MKQLRMKEGKLDNLASLCAEAQQSCWSHRLMGLMRSPTLSSRTEHSLHPSEQYVPVGKEPVSRVSVVSCAAVRLISGV